MTTFEKLKDELHARYTIKYDFLRAFFIKNPRHGEILSYLIGLEDMWNAAGQFFQADEKYVANGLGCSTKTVSRAYAEFKRLNLIEWQSAKSKGTLVRINQDGIEKLYKLVMENDIYRTPCPILLDTMSNIVDTTSYTIGHHVPQLSNKLSNELPKEIEQTSKKKPTKRQSHQTLVNKNNNPKYQESITTKDEDYIRNEDGSYKVY